MVHSLEIYGDTHDGSRGKEINELSKDQEKMLLEQKIETDGTGAIAEVNASDLSRSAKTNVRTDQIRELGLQ